MKIVASPTCPKCGEAREAWLTTHLSPDDLFMVHCESCQHTFRADEPQAEVPPPKARRVMKKTRREKKFICPECQGAVLRRARTGDGRTKMEDRLYHCPTCGVVIMGEDLKENWHANQRPNVEVVP